MVKDHRSWPYPLPQHVAWPSLQVHSAYMNRSTCIFPGFTAPAIPNLETKLTNEVQGFLQYPDSEPCLRETHAGAGVAMANANHASLQRKLLIFDHSGSKTRLLYSPVFPLVQSPIVTATQFAQVYDDVNGEAQATTKHLPTHTSAEESGKDHIDNEESEMHEDTEEINALLESDDDEVTSTGHSPLLVTKRTYVMQEQFADMKEEVASSDWPNKRHKLIDGEYNRLPPLVVVDSASSSERLNETCKYASDDAESKHSSSSSGSRVYAADIELKKDKIRELLRVLENLTPGAKGKHPLLVIDGTIEYLKSLTSQAGSTLK